jgi:hypothetical protein
MQEEVHLQLLVEYQMALEEIIHLLVAVNQTQQVDIYLQLQEEIPTQLQELVLQLVVVKVTLQQLKQLL